MSTKDNTPHSSFIHAQDVGTTLGHQITSPPRLQTRLLSHCVSPSFKPIASPPSKHSLGSHPHQDSFEDPYEYSMVALDLSKPVAPSVWSSSISTGVQDFTTDLALSHCESNWTQRLHNPYTPYNQNHDHLFTSSSLVPSPTTTSLTTLMNTARPSSDMVCSNSVAGATLSNPPSLVAPGAAVPDQHIYLQSNNSDSTPQLRLRTAQACEKCRARKAKCSGEHPACQRCRNRGIACEYRAEGRVRSLGSKKLRASSGFHSAGNGVSSRYTAGTTPDHMPLPPTTKHDLATSSYSQADAYPYYSTLPYRSASDGITSLGLPSRRSAYGTPVTPTLARAPLHELRLETASLNAAPGRNVIYVQESGYSPTPMRHDYDTTFNHDGDDDTYPSPDDTSTATNSTLNGSSAGASPIEAPVPVHGMDLVSFRTLVERSPSHESTHSDPSGDDVKGFRINFPEQRRGTVFEVIPPGLQQRKKNIFIGSNGERWGVEGASCG